MPPNFDLDQLSKHDLLVVKKLLEIRDTRIEFATKYHRNTRGEPMNFVDNPHLIALYNTLARTLVLMGSVQSLKSEYVIIDHLASAACGLSIFFVLPKFEERTTYVQNRIDKRIGEVPEYRRLLSSGSFDNVAIKQFGKGVIKYVGSNVVADFREFPADLVFVDELDDCSQLNIGYAEDRLKHSPYQFVRYISNPTVKGRGISRWFDKSNQNEWHVPCTKCGEFIKLDWFACVIDQKYDDEGVPVEYWLRDTDWHANCGRDIRCICPKCGNPINRCSKDGQWVQSYPESEIEGFHLTQLNSVFNPIETMYRDYVDAWETGVGMPHFYNSTLGLPFVSETSKLTVELMRRCAFSNETQYQFQLKKFCGHVVGDCSKGPCSMGIDVGNKFDVRISEIQGDKRKAVFLGKVDTADELILLMGRYNVLVAVIDSAPEPRVVDEVTERAPKGCYVWSCKYDGEGSDKRTRYVGKERRLMCDRTTALDKGLGEFKARRNLLPTNFEGIMSGKYVEEMIGPVREEETDAKGNVKFIWSKCKDHQRHADVYDLLASSFCEGKNIRAFVG